MKLRFSFLDDDIEVQLLTIMLINRKLLQYQKMAVISFRYLLQLKLLKVISSVSIYNKILLVLSIFFS